MNKHYQKLEQQVQKGKDVFIANNATVIGDVTLGDKVSVWYQAVIRGDADKIEIGKETNIQDGVIIHVDEGVPVKIGKQCVIGHAAMLHGCTIGDNTLIGIKATVMNNAIIGKGCIIGAHALVTEGKVIPDYSMVLGSPGKIVKQLPESIIQKIQSGVDHYVEEAKKYLDAE